MRVSTMLHNLETNRHWSFQAWSRSQTRITVMLLHNDKNSKFSLLPKELVSAIADLADVRLGACPSCERKTTTASQAELAAVCV